MRPIHLRVSGLHSYREAVDIDFDDLGRYGLFGIFGAIGAGKSSLLDAITLALYGEVDRLQGRSRRGLLNHHAKQIEVRFRFQVTPTGTDQPVRYEVHRVYRHQKSTDSVQLSAARLTRLDDHEVLAEKATTVDEQVQSILGLTAEDFMRAVVLPQGRFMQFLHLKGSDRRRMLQRIFRLGAYGKGIRDQIRGRLSAVDTRIAKIEGARSTLGNTSDEARDKAVAELASAEQSRAEAERTWASVDDAHQRAAAVRERQQAVREAERELEAHLERQGQVLADEERAAEAEKVQSALEPWRRWQNAREKRSTLQPRHQARQQAAEKAVARHTELARSQQQLDARVSSEGKALRAEVSRLDELVKVHARFHDTVKQLETVSRDLEEKSAAEEAASKKKAELFRRETVLEADRAKKVKDRKAVTVSPRERRALERAQHAWQKVRLQEEEVRAARDVVSRAEEAEEDARARVASALDDAGDFSRAVKEAESALESAEATNVDIGAAREEMDAVKALQPLLDTLAEATLARDRLRVALSDAETRLDEASNAQEIARSNLADAREHAADAEAAMATLRRRQHVHTLALGLDTDTPCPVCGSEDHPEPATASDPGEIDEAMGQQRRAQQALQAQVAAEAAAEEKRIHAEATTRRLGRELHDATARVQTLTERLPEDVRTADDPSDALVTRHKAAATTLREAQTLVEYRERLRRELEAIRLKASEQSRPLAKAEAALEHARSGREQAEAELERRKTAAGDAWAAFDADRGGMSPFELESAARQLAVKDERHAALSTEVEELDTQISAIEAERDSVDAERDTLGEARARLEEKHSALVDQRDQLEESLGDWDADRSPRPVLDATRKQLESLETAVRDNRQQLDMAAKMRADAERDLASIAATLEAHTEAERISAEALDKALFAAELTSEPSLDDTDRAKLGATLESRALSPDRIRAAQEAATAWRQQHAVLEERLANKRGDLGEAVLTEREWAEACEALEAAQKAVDAAREARSAAEHALRDLQARREKAAELDGDLDTVSEEKSQLDQLDQLFRGNRFVEFLANDHLRDLAEEATRHLGRLSNHRYGLLLDDDGGFVVRDEDAGGAARPVTSLSGGETFLTSLALALALSSQVQARGNQPLEFFFLDEGFGTLDAHSLDRVMGAIESLRSENRLIGIISHVSAVRERVPRYLMVHEAGRDGTGSSVEVVDGP